MATPVVALALALRRSAELQLRAGSPRRRAGCEQRILQTEIDTDVQRAVCSVRAARCCATGGFRRAEPLDGIVTCSAPPPIR
jgi:hypothetical protein